MTLRNTGFLDLSIIQYCNKCNVSETGSFCLGWEVGDIHVICMKRLFLIPFYFQSVSIHSANVV
jgi:hypothetical protein